MSDDDKDDKDDKKPSRRKQARVTVTRVASSVKGGVDLPLAPLTLLLGKSASGKTEVVQSIELALGQGASDVAGRTWMRDDSDLLRHLAAGRHALGASCTLSDGRAIGWAKPTGKAAVPVLPDGMREPFDPTVVLPLRLLREALTGSDEKAHRFLLSAIGKSITHSDVLMRIPQQLHELYASLAGGKFPVGGAIQGLMMAREDARKRALDATKEAAGASKLADQLIRSGGATAAMTLPTEAELTVARAKVTEYQTALAALESAEQTHMTFAMLPNRLAQMLPEIVERQQELDRLAAASNCAVNTQYLGFLREMAEFAAKDLTAGHSDCALCGQPVDVAAALARTQAIVDACNTALAEVKDATAAVIRRTHLQHTQDAAVAQYKAAEAQLATMQSALPPRPTSEQLAIARGALTGAQAYLNALSQAQGASGQFQEAQTNAQRMKEHAQRMTDLRDACDRAVELLVDRGVSDLVKRVQAYLPDGPKWVFGLTVTPEFAIGFRRPGPEDPNSLVLHTALSGAEWALMMLAIGCALSEGVPKDIPVVLLPEERMWDGETLAVAMRALAAAKPDCQIVLTSTVPPVGRTPAGWVVTKIEKPQESNGEKPEKQENGNVNG